MATNDEIDKKIEELDIVKAIEHKDVPYVIAQIRGLINEARANEREQSIVKAAQKAGKNAFYPSTKEEIICLLKQPDTQITMTTETLQEMLKDEDTNTAKQIFEVLNSFFEPREIYDKDGYIMDMPTMNLIKYLEYQKQCKKKYGVD